MSPSLRSKLRLYELVFCFIFIEHNGLVIATYDLLGEEVKKLEVTGAQGKRYVLSFILELYEKKFGLDIGQYGLNEYENEKGYFLLNIRSEDLVKLRDYKLTKLGL